MLLKRNSNKAIQARYSTTLIKITPNKSNILDTEVLAPLKIFEQFLEIFLFAID